MGRPFLRRLPGAVAAVTLLAELLAVVLSWGLEPAYDTLLYAGFSCVLASTGALVVTRHHRHPVGWLLLGLGVANALTGDLAQGWGLRAVAEGWPGGALAAWIALSSWLPQAPAIALILLLCPSGPLLDRRLQVVPWLTGVGAVVGQAGFSLDPDTARLIPGGRNPFATDALPTDAMFALGLGVVAAGQVAAAIDDLRELAHGLRPALLGSGLEPALRDLASRMPVPVEVVANGGSLRVDSVSGKGTRLTAELPCVS